MPRIANRGKELGSTQLPDVKHTLLYDAGLRVSLATRANLLRTLQLNDQAIAAFTKAAEFTLRPAGLLTELAILLFELGRRDEAWQVLDRAFAARYDSAALRARPLERGQYAQVQYT